MHGFYSGGIGQLKTGERKMNRFYKEALKALKQNNQQEILSDIVSYVDYLKHERAVLISALARNSEIEATILLKGMGLKTDDS